MGGMMAGVLTEGRAESGYGVVMAGFHFPARDFGLKLDALKKEIGSVSRIAAAEQAGYITFVAVGNSYVSGIVPYRVAFYRKEPHKFFPELSPFLKSIRAEYIQDIVLTESLGVLQMTLLYSPAPGVEEASA